MDEDRLRDALVAGEALRYETTLRTGGPLGETDDRVVITRSDDVVTVPHNVLCVVRALHEFALASVALAQMMTAKTQLVATQVALIATLLPAMLLSGFLFEIRSMPVALRAITFLVPARYYITASRGVMLKGVGPETLWVQAAFMVAFADFYVWMVSIGVWPDVTILTL